MKNVFGFAYQAHSRPAHKPVKSLAHQHSKDAARYFVGYGMDYSENTQVRESVADPQPSG